MDATARLRQLEMQVEHLGEHLMLAEETQAAARNAHAAGDNALRQEFDHRAITAVATAQNRALANFKQTVWQTQDRHAVQFAQA